VAPGTAPVAESKTASLAVVDSVRELERRSRHLGLCGRVVGFDAGPVAPPVLPTSSVSSSSAPSIGHDSSDTTVRAVRPARRRLLLAAILPAARRRP
jgi:hypothetical protein